MKKKLILVRGLPGSGKSTLAKALGVTGATHVEADDFFIDAHGEYQFDAAQLGDAHIDAQRRTINALKKGMDVVVANTFTRKIEMVPYLQIAAMENAEVVVFVAKGDWGSVHNVPEGVLRKMRERWEE